MCHVWVFVLALKILVYSMQFGEVLHEKALLSHECFHSEISANAKTGKELIYWSAKSDNA